MALMSDEMLEAMREKYKELLAPREKEFPPIPHTLQPVYPDSFLAKPLPFESDDAYRRDSLIIFEDDCHEPFNTRYSEEIKTNFKNQEILTDFNNIKKIYNDNIFNKPAPQLNYPHNKVGTMSPEELRRFLDSLVPVLTVADERAIDSQLGVLASL